MAFDTAESPQRTGLSRRFYFTVAVMLAGIVFVGFAPSFYLRPWFERPPTTVFAMIHGAIFTGWMVLFVAQTWLIAERNVALHRRLGLFGAVLAVLMMIVAVEVSLGAAARGFTPFPSQFTAIQFSIVSLSGVPVFTILVGIALLTRKRDLATHKRLMLLATISIIEPAIARWPLQIMMTGPWPAVLFSQAMLLAVILADTVKHRRLHPAMVWGGLLIVASQLLRPIVGHSAAWESFVKFLIGA